MEAVVFINLIVIVVVACVLLIPSIIALVNNSTTYNELNALKNTVNNMCNCSELTNNLNTLNNTVYNVLENEAFGSSGVNTTLELYNITINVINQYEMVPYGVSLFEKNIQNGGNHYNVSLNGYYLVAWSGSVTQLNNPIRIAIYLNETTLISEKVINITNNAEQVIVPFTTLATYPLYVGDRISFAVANMQNTNDVNFISFYTFIMYISSSSGVTQMMSLLNEITYKPFSFDTVPRNVSYKPEDDKMHHLGYLDIIIVSILTFSVLSCLFGFCFIIICYKCKQKSHPPQEYTKVSTEDKES